MRDNPEIPIITIHDSIMTTPAHVGTVRQAMADAFAAVGLRPTLKIEVAPKRCGWRRSKVASVATAQASPPSLERFGGKKSH